MGDHFVLLVDRLITESTLEAAIESRKQAKLGFDATSSADLKAEFRKGPGSGKLVECRICQEDDEDCNMEIPCSCCGSLKYAHRKCVQRWCNEKGDTVCEICLQQFKPNYTSPPKLLFRYGRIPMNFRGNWEITRRDNQNQQFMTMVPTDRTFVGSSSEDDYASSSARAIIFCRLVAVLFMIILVVRNGLPMFISGPEHYSLALFILLMLRTAGVVVPIYAILRAVTTFHRRRLQQDDTELPISPFVAENLVTEP